MVKVSLGSDPARLLCLLRARLAALGASTLPGTGRPSGRPAMPRVLERAASKVAEFTAFDHAGRQHTDRRHRGDGAGVRRRPAQPDRAQRPVQRAPRTACLRADRARGAPPARERHRTPAQAQAPTQAPARPTPQRSATTHAPSLTLRLSLSLHLLLHLRPGASPALAGHRAPRPQAGEHLLYYDRAAVGQTHRPGRRGAHSSQSTAMAFRLHSLLLLHSLHSLHSRHSLHSPHTLSHYTY